MVCGFHQGANCAHDCAKGVEVNEEVLLEFCPMKEDELDAVRFRVSYRAENLYLLVVLREGKPWEVFVEHATNSKHEVQYMLASWDCNTRFISKSLKIDPLNHVIGQLRKSSRLRNDLPNIIANSLERWL